MSTLGELFNDIHARHTEYTNQNNLAGIEGLISEYENLLNHAPDEIAFLFALGTVKLQLGMHGSAIALFQQALTINDQVPEILNNLGSAWKGENDNVKAKEYYERALALRDDADYYNNMATLYVNEGNPVECERWARDGLVLSPEHSRIHWNLSLSLLEQGKWAEGFDEYEYGLKSLDRPDRNYEVPFWDGTPGKKIVVYGEQGMGDEIMWASCLPDVMKDCDVVFDCHDRMIDIFTRSFKVKCYPTRKDNELHWVQKEKLDAKVAIGSLFKFYRREGEFPKVPYLKADPRKVKKWRKKLEKLGPGPYVGVGWKAGGKKTRHDLRSLKLGWFKPVFEQGGTFVSLQYTADAGGKVKRFEEDSGYKIHHWADTVETGLGDNRFAGLNYDETVSLVGALDLVICPNTTLVHLCGALGKDCWTLTPKACAWRYQLQGSEMPMYGPWVRQFREEGVFSELLEQIAEEYGRYLRKAA